MDLETIAIKGYSALPKAPSNVISRTLVGEVSFLCKETSGYSTAPSDWANIFWNSQKSKIKEFLGAVLLNETKMLISKLTKILSEHLSLILDESNVWFYLKSYIERNVCVCVCVCVLSDFGWIQCLWFWIDPMSLAWDRSNVFHFGSNDVPTQTIINL